jgi:hypothetical protein
MRLDPFGHPGLPDAPAAVKFEGRGDGWPVEDVHVQAVVVTYRATDMGAPGACFMELVSPSWMMRRASAATAGEGTWCPALRKVTSVPVTLTASARPGAGGGHRLDQNLVRTPSATSSGLRSISASP